MAIFNSYLTNYQRVTGWWLLLTPLKNDGLRQLGWSFPIYGKNGKIFQTTNQYMYVFYPHQNNRIKPNHWASGTLLHFRKTTIKFFNSFFYVYQRITTINHLADGLSSGLAAEICWILLRCLATGTTFRKFCILRSRMWRSTIKTTVWCVEMHQLYWKLFFLRWICMYILYDIMYIIHTCNIYIYIRIIMYAYIYTLTCVYYM